MCHEEIHRRPRLDLADCDPDAHPDCKRSPSVPVELLIRQQLLLTISRLGERFCSRPESCSHKAAALHSPPFYRVVNPRCAESASVSSPDAFRPELSKIIPFAARTTLPP